MKIKQSEVKAGKMEIRYWLLPDGSKIPFTVYMGQPIPAA
jgi:hypothetical protein